MIGRLPNEPDPYWKLHDVIRWLTEMSTSSEVDPQDNEMAAKALGFVKLLELILNQRNFRS